MSKSDLNEYIKKQMKLSEEFNRKMKPLNEFSIALKTKDNNSAFSKFVHPICRFFSLGYPSHKSKVQSFGEAPDCIPLFHMTCKTCGYKWREGL